MEAKNARILFYDNFEVLTKHFMYNYLQFWSIGTTYYVQLFTIFEYIIELYNEFNVCIRFNNVLVKKCKIC